MLLFIFIAFFIAVVPDNAQSVPMVDLRTEVSTPASTTSEMKPFNSNQVHTEGYAEGINLVTTTEIQHQGSETCHKGNPPTGEQSHPLDYELFAGVGYYKVYYQPTTWHQAQRICESENAHLIVLDRTEEAKIIKQLMTRGGYVSYAAWSDVWFAGFSDQEKEGHFVTVLGKPLVTNDKIGWLEGLSHNELVSDSVYDVGSHCGVYHLYPIGLNVAPCSAFLPFICEQPL